MFHVLTNILDGEESREQWNINHYGPWAESKAPWDNLPQSHQVHLLFVAHSPFLFQQVKWGGLYLKFWKKIDVEIYESAIVPFHP